MGELGIGDDDTVVAYDDQGGVIAARLVWLLRVTGHEAALLDGGIAAWDGPLETEPAQRPPATLHPAPLATRGARHRRRRGRPGQRRHRRPPARALPRRGPDPVDPRPGHIPGARSLASREHLGPDGRLLPVEELRAPLRRGRRRRHPPRRLLLRLGRDRLPQPDRPRARRPGHRPPLRRLLVAVEQRPHPPSRHGTRLITMPDSATELVAAYPRRRPLAGRGHRGDAPADRGARRRPQRLLPRRRRSRRWRTRARPRRAGARRARRPPRRRPRRRQGPAGHQGLADAARLARDRPGRPMGRRRAGRRRAAPLGAVLPGKTTTPELGWKGVTDSPLDRRHPQPVGPGQDPGRLQRRQLGGARRRHGPARARHRRRRLDPDPVRVLRPARAQADLRPRARVAGEPVRPGLARRPDGAHGRRPGAAARRDRAARRPRLDSAPAADGAPSATGSTTASPACASPSARSSGTPPSTPRSQRSSRRPRPRFAELGAHVEQVDPGFADPRETFDVLWSTGAARAVAASAPRTDGHRPRPRARSPSRGALTRASTTCARAASATSSAIA